MSTNADTKKTVRFARNKHLKRVPPCSEYSESQKKSLWIQPYELEAMREDLLHTIALVRQEGLDLDTEKHCVRGTELGIPELIEPRKIHKKEAIDAVVAESRRQHDVGRSDLNALRDVSRKYSLKNAAQAYHQGLKDAISLNIQSVRESRRSQCAKLLQVPEGAHLLLTKHAMNMHEPSLRTSRRDS